jgi:nucleoside-diphosphate-sugar epimerase
MKNCDVVVHAAFDPEHTARQDQRELEAIRASAHDGRVRRVLYTSGIYVYGDTAGAIVDESSPLDPAGSATWRPAHEEVVLDLGVLDVTSVILRPGVIYGGNDGMLGDWFKEARERHTVTYPGEGLQRWVMVHRDDVAEAYRLALEHGGNGERYVLSDESRFTVRELAEAVAHVTGATAVSLPRDRIAETLGPAGLAQLLDQQATGLKARRDLGWVPRHTSFVAEAETLYREWQAGQHAAVS